MKILVILGSLMLVTGGSTLLLAQTPPDALQPGDVVRLRVYREPDLSGEFPVNEQGSLALPRLGTVHVVEWPADSIRPRVTRAMSEFLRDPVIEITLLRRIAIYGFVIKPGLYPVDPTMTVQEALALAGGAVTEGRKDRVELIRNNQRLMTNLAETTQLRQIQLRSGDQLFVPELSWWARNGRVVVPSIIGAAATVTAVLLRR